LFTSETKVLSVLIFDLKESGDLAAISVLGLTMLIITAAVIIAATACLAFPAGCGCGTIEKARRRLMDSRLAVEQKSGGTLNSLTNEPHDHRN